MRSRSAFAILILALTTVGPGGPHKRHRHAPTGPADGQRHAVAFLYAGDLWSASLDGTEIGA